MADLSRTEALLLLLYLKDASEPEAIRRLAGLGFTPSEVAPALGKNYEAVKKAFQKIKKDKSPKAKRIAAAD